MSKSIIYASACALYLIIHVFGYSPARQFLQVIVVFIFFTKIWSLK
jgi:hypothetical protein